MSAYGYSRVASESCESNSFNILCRLVVLLQTGSNSDGGILKFSKRLAKHVDEKGFI
jgi:hypothetical protein